MSEALTHSEIANPEDVSLSKGAASGHLNIGKPETDGLWVSAVDEVALVAARAADLTTRSIKTSSKMAALHLAISCSDLTTLEGIDTADKVRSICAKAISPDPRDASLPSVAAVCVYPEMVRVAKLGA